MDTRGNNGKIAVKTPIDVIMAMARDEVRGTVFSVMQANAIPPGLMASILEGVLLEVRDEQVTSLAREFTKLQEAENAKTEN